MTNLLSSLTACTPPVDSKGTLVAAWAGGSGPGGRRVLEALLAWFDAEQQPKVKALWGKALI